MRIKTYKKRRKIKLKEEYIIKKLMNKCKVSKKDIHVAVFKSAYDVKCKYYICVNRTKLINYYPSFQSLKPYSSVNPFGEFEHSEGIK